MIKLTGFTLIEVIIVIAILTVLITVSITSLYSIQRKSDLDNGIQEFVIILKLAQNKTLSSDNSSQYGVYLDASVFPNKYILFKGSNYASRNVSYDQIYFLSQTVEFFGINLNGGNEIVFDKLTGKTQQPGSVVLRLKADTSQTKTVYISSSGTVDFLAPVAPSDSARVKDSRHVQFNYTKDIGGTNLTLNFSYNGSTTSVSVIVDSFTNSGVFNWSANNISVSGTSMLQCIKMHTNSVTNPIKFDVYRDGRCNNTKLNIVSSSDSNKIIDYSLDGSSVTHTSTYSDASNSSWQ